MEAGALQTTAALPRLAGRSPLLRLKSDEQLVALTRRGHQGAFEVLVQRYQSRLLAFCRHMLGSTEDAEDVLQEVFAASFNALMADERAINARPWLYRIARNRCLNHLRRPAHSGQDSMDIFETDSGATTADAVHKREEFRQVVADVQQLPETQRTALLLREIDALSYDDIAHAMDTTVPSVKSLLVRARVSLAEAAEARLLTCEEVRVELGQVAEGLARTTAPARRHLKGCERCRVFRGELRRANRALAAVYPLGPLVVIKKFVTAKAGVGAGTAGGGAAAAAGGATSAGAGGVFSAGLGTIASKAAAGFAAAAIVTAGAVEVHHAAQPAPVHQAAGPALVAAAPHAVPHPAPAPHLPARVERHSVVAVAAAVKPHPAPAAKQPVAPLKPQPPAQPAKPATAPPPQSAPPTTVVQQGPAQESGSTVSLGSSSDGSGTSTSAGDSSQSPPGAGQSGGGESTSPPGESSSAPAQPPTAPVVGDPHGSPHG